MLHSPHKIYHRQMWEFMITLFQLMEQNGITEKFQGKSCTLSQQLALDHFSLIILHTQSRPSTGISEFSPVRLLTHLPCTLKKWSLLFIYGQVFQDNKKVSYTTSNCMWERRAKGRVLLCVADHTFGTLTKGKHALNC